MNDWDTITGFEWDHFKAEANVVKHGTRFQVALEVFSDPHVIFEDDPYSIGEYRELAIGASQSGVLFVVFTLRRGNLARIISARRAKANERRKYRSIR